MDRDEEEFFYENEDPDNADEYLAEHLGHVCKAFFLLKSRIFEKEGRSFCTKTFFRVFQYMSKVVQNKAY